MYCPVDGIEWREGITRCPEHDVDLVDEPPEIEEESRPVAFSADAAMRAGVRVAAWAAVFYAISGILVSGWFALARQRDWMESSVLDAFRFAHEASTDVLFGTLGLIAAVVLGRTFTRLGSPLAAPRTTDELDEPPSGREAWIVTLLTSFVAVFAFVWILSGVALAWQEVRLELPFGGFPSRGYLKLNGLHNAAFSCGIGALVILGAVLVARAYDRLTGIR